MAKDNISIYNLALFHVGHSQKVISPTEKTTERRHCETVYDPYRIALLTMAKWSFATITETLTLTGNSAIGYEYEYKYPSGCLKALEIARGSAKNDKIPFKTAAVKNATTGKPERVIWTNEPNASLIYIFDVEDVAMFTPLFNLTLAHYMGVPIARVLAQSSRTATEMFQLAQYYFNQAVLSGEVEAEDFDLPEPDWITDR